MDMMRNQLRPADRKIKTHARVEAGLAKPVNHPVEYVIVAHRRQINGLSAEMRAVRRGAHEHRVLRRRPQSAGYCKGHPGLVSRHVQFGA